MLVITLGILIITLLMFLRKISRIIAKCGSCRYSATLPCGLYCSACRNADLWQPYEADQ